MQLVLDSVGSTPLVRGTQPAIRSKGTAKWSKPCISIPRLRLSSSIHHGGNPVEPHGVQEQTVLAA